jgi:hypothetical protein
MIDKADVFDVGFGVLTEAFGGFFGVLCCRIPFPKNAEWIHSSQTSGPLRRWNKRFWNRTG